MLEWLEQDKLLHFFASACIALGSYVVAQGMMAWWLAMIIAIVVAAIAGVGKELFDKMLGYTGFDKKDLIADGAGILFGIICVIVSVLL